VPFVVAGLSDHVVQFVGDGHATRVEEYGVCCRVCVACLRCGRVMGHVPSGRATPCAKNAAMLASRVKRSKSLNKQTANDDAAHTNGLILSLMTAARARLRRRAMETIPSVSHRQRLSERLR